MFILIVKPMNGVSELPSADLAQPTNGELKTELIRKCIHLSIALVPMLASIDYSHTALLLMGGTLFYTFAESLRFLGFAPPLVSSLTSAALRRREVGHFVLGPVTLGLGAILALILFPPPVAAIAIYTLAFGDSTSTLVGKFLGHIRPACLKGKSLEGSIACLAVVFFIGFHIFQDWKLSLAAGLASFAIDILPLEDFDNLLLPLVVGFTVFLFQHL